MRFLILSALLSLSFTSHKYYVSNTFIEHDALSQSFEITMKIFTDDLERAIEERVHQRLFLGDPELEHEHAESYVEEYLQERFHLNIDNQDRYISFIGMEVEFDMMYCYMEVTSIPDFHSIRVANDILYELFPEQKNIIDVRFGGWSEKTVCTSAYPVQDVLR